MEYLTEINVYTQKGLRAGWAGLGWAGLEDINLCFHFQIRNLHNLFKLPKLGDQFC